MSKKTNIKVVPPESLLKDSDFQKISSYEKSHKAIKTLNDPRFGEITIYQNPQTREAIAVREKKFSDKAEAGRMVLAARNRIAIKHKNLINLLDYSITKKSELCSSFYILKHFFEYPKSDLRKQIQDREKNGQAFNSAELTHLLYQQNQALAFIQSQGLAHGDVQPLHIGYDPEKLISQLIDQSDQTNTDLSIIQGQKNRLISRQPLYQSPTMYSNLKKGNLKFQFDKNKEDTFAFGLVLLEAGNGKSIQNIYDAKTGNINQAALQQHIDDFNRRFQNENQILILNVQSMTNLNENNRPSPTAIQASLPPYDQVCAFLAQGGELNTNANNNGGENQIIITTTKELAPEIEYDLFSFDASTNPYIIQNQYEGFETGYENQSFDLINKASTEYIMKTNQLGTQAVTQPSSEINAKSIYVNNGHWNSDQKFDFYKQDHPNSIVYSRLPDNWHQAAQDLGPQTGKPMPHNNAEVPISETQLSGKPVINQLSGDTPRKSYPKTIASTHSEQQISSYMQIPTVIHEFRLHDSRIIQPDVISNYSVISDNSYSLPPSSNHVYSQPTNGIYQTSYKPLVNTIYVRAPAQTLAYTEAPNQSSYFNRSARNISYSRNPPHNGTYNQTPVQTVIEEASVYKKKYVSESPVQPYNYTKNYQPLESQSIFDTTGLKLVGTYIDTKFATKKGNN